MPDTQTLAIFLVATLALLLVPGPAVLYIVARGIDQGRTAGLASAVGIATGSFFHVVAAALGLSAILASSALAFSVVKYLGAAYLIFLGVRTLLTRPDPTEVIDSRPRTIRELYTQGVIVQVLNPKIALFFLAFLPQFVNPARGSVTAQTLFFGGLLMMMGLCTDSTYALISGSAGDWLKQQPAFATAQRYVAGIVFIGLGMTTALTGSKSK
jgi:threonine/homoserine/homoserine lactone efflux protein